MWRRTSSAPFHRSAQVLVANLGSIRTERVCHSPAGTYRTDAAATGPQLGVPSGCHSQAGTEQFPRSKSLMTKLFGWSVTWNVAFTLPTVPLPLLTS